MSMWIYEDIWETEEFQAYQREVRRFEGVYLETRILLRDAEVELRADPGNVNLESKVKNLRERVENLESQSARLASDHPLEISLWGPPHG